MGIINVTPDSFSDGGKFFTAEEALRRARNLLSEGADILDIGGESTRPGATPIEWSEEWRRVEPVLAGLAGSPAILSIDTYHPETARRALALGVRIVNCVRPESVPDMIAIVTENPGAELVLPASERALAAAVPGLAGRCWLDPMIGFGTTREEDLARLRAIGELAKEGRVLVGASRKRIVKRLTGVKVGGKDLAGNLAIAVWCALHGASAVRVHDVAETVQALKVIQSLKEVQS